MQAVQIQIQSSIDQRLYLLQSSNEEAMHYATILRHPNSDHLCAYLNVSRDLYYNAFGNDALIPFDPTYYGIGSTILTVNSKVADMFPTPVFNWWIGIDYQNQPQPGDDEILIRLRGILDVLIMTKGEDK